MKKRIRRILSSLAIAAALAGGVVFATDWTTPKTWVTGELVTASHLNTHLRDNLLYLFEQLQLTEVRLYSDNASRSNTGTSQTDLGSYSVQANTLDEDGDRLLVIGFGTFANTGNTKTWRFVWGASSTTLTANTTAGVEPWKVEAEIVRTSATTQKIHVRIAHGTGSAVWRQFYVTATETLSSAVTVKLTGQSSAASNDITEESFVVYRR